MKKAENDIKKELPNDWKMKSLGTIASLITKGSTPTTYGYSYQERGVKFIKIENIKDGKINIPSIEFFISDEAHNSQQRSKLKEDCLEGTCELFVRTRQERTFPMMHFR